MALDADLYFRTTADGALTTDEAETTHILDLGEGTPLAGKPLWLWYVVPTRPGSDTLTLTLYFDNDSAIGSPDYSQVLPVVSATGFYAYPFASRRRYVGLKLDNSATSSWGVVQAGITDSDPRVRSGD